MPTVDDARTIRSLRQDLLIPPVVVFVLWPLTEWVLHEYVLHLRPRELLGRRFDPDFARKHRDHHGEPWHLPHVFLPARVVIAVVPPVLTLVWLAIPAPGIALTTMVALTGVALHYEWIHYLTHTSVTPHSEWFRRVRRSHRYHHFKNERYWYGFTFPLVDRLLGTSLSPTAVETSNTARTLGIDQVD